MDGAVHRHTLRVLLVEDHAAARGGLRLRLSREPDMAIVGEAPVVADALRLAAELAPDVAIVDLALPDGDGIELVGRLRAAMPGLRGVILTLQDTPEHRHRALIMGANGFVGKHEPVEVLLAAIRG